MSLRIAGEYWFKWFLKWKLVSVDLLFIRNWWTKFMFLIPVQWHNVMSVIFFAYSRHSPVRDWLTLRSNFFNLVQWTNKASTCLSRSLIWYLRLTSSMCGQLRAMLVTMFRFCAFKK
jgi:hypothetical protein